MANARATSDELRELVNERVALEQRLRNESGPVSDKASAAYDRDYARLERSLANLFRSTDVDEERTMIMLELMRIMENKLVYLQNFIVEPTRDNQLLAALVTQFLDDAGSSGRAHLTTLEATYYRAIGALYGGQVDRARQGFQAACESEESDEANDIKYKSYVILGNLSHEAQDYAGARELHDQSMKFAQHDNVTAQALAFKALNSYALGDREDALELFEQALARFDPSAPFFNSYFHRNALLFCGSIHMQKKNYGRAEECYRSVMAEVEPSSYDHFDATAQLGKIAYATGRLDEAVDCFRRGIEHHRMSENEHLIDACFWLARTYLKQGNADEAKKMLERVAASDVQSQRKTQAAQLLAQVG